MKILQIGDPILEKKTKKITDFDSKKLQSLIDKLEKSVTSDDESAGLAAPQVGESLAVCTVKVITSDNESEKPEVITLINPRIIKKSKDKSIYWEGCLSVGIGDDRLFGPVKRSSSVNIEYYDRTGERKTLEAYGYFSHIVQHEMDHLEGILFVQYITNPKNLWKNKDLDKYIDENGCFPSVIGENMVVPELIVD